MISALCYLLVLLIVCPETGVLVCCQTVPGEVCIPPVARRSGPQGNLEGSRKSLGCIEDPAARPGTEGQGQTRQSVLG